MITVHCTKCGFHDRYSDDPGTKEAPRKGVLQEIEDVLHVQKSYIKKVKGELKFPFCRYCSPQLTTEMLPSHIKQRTTVKKFFIWKKETK